MEANAPERRLKLLLTITLFLNLGYQVYKYRKQIRIILLKRLKHVFKLILKIYYI